MNKKVVLLIFKQILLQKFASFLTLQFYFKRRLQLLYFQIFKFDYLTCNFNFLHFEHVYPLPSFATLHFGRYCDVTIQLRHKLIMTSRYLEVSARLSGDRLHLWRHNRVFMTSQRFTIPKSRENSVLINLFIISWKLQ